MSPDADQQMQEEDPLSDVTAHYPPGHVSDLGLIDPKASRKAPMKGSLTQIVHRIPMNLKLKRVEERTKMSLAPEAYPDYCCAAVVSLSHHERAGPVLRVLNNNVPGIPHEVVAIRLPFMHHDTIPRFIYTNEQTFKEWAVDQVERGMRKNGSNLAEHPKISVSHYTARYSVGSLTPEAKSALGTNEAGLWIFHYPNLVHQLKGRDYSDGTSELFYVINLHVSLITASQRLHVPEGGWGRTDPELTNLMPKRPEGPAEKRTRTNRVPSRFDELSAALDRTQSTLAQAANLQKSVMEYQKAAIVPPYPQLPPGHAAPGGATPWPSPDDDMPKFI